MILTDYLRSEKDLSWDIARQCGVQHATIRLPEDGKFDLNDKAHWETLFKKYNDFGFIPTVLEPMPNELHDHIKAGDEKRDEAIEKVIGMFPIMDALDIRTICFNFMAHIGWLRTSSTVSERGGAHVTEFNLKDFKDTGALITEDELWYNYEYFIRAVIPHAEKYGIKLALHPDDPPVPRLGGVSRIMISYENIRRAVRDIVSSDSLGVTMCQANYFIMGEDLFKVIPALADKIMMIHFRNTTGTIEHFRETFHDNGELPMAKLIKCYRDCGVNVPIRVDHVPTMVGESQQFAGYDALGRLFAIGYLKGILESCE